MYRVICEDILMDPITIDKPVDMVIFCPSCGFKHVDAPSEGWENPPHTSHLCLSCGLVFRLCDIPTNGVEFTETTGSRDTWFSRNDRQQFVKNIEDKLEALRENESKNNSEKWFYLLFYSKDTKILISGSLIKARGINTALYMANEKKLVPGDSDLEVYEMFESVKINENFASRKLTPEEIEKEEFIDTEDEVIGV